ncbi:707_t:CDS:2, partial [Entrophospora sp. SA101]
TREIPTINNFVMNAVGITKSSTGEEFAVHIVAFYPRDPDVKTNLQRIEPNQFARVGGKFMIDDTDVDNSNVKFLKVMATNLTIMELENEELEPPDIVVTMTATAMNQHGRDGVNMSNITTDDKSAASKAQFAFGADTFRRIQPQEYLRKFVQQNIRPDGRSFNAFPDGSSMIRIGNTTVVCGIKAEVAEPKFDTPREGYLVPNVELSPVCSPKFKPGPPSEQAQVLCESLYRLVKESSILDLECLCIEESKAVWVLYADLVCINYDGNIFDACVIAFITALNNLKLRKATYEDGMVKATEEREIMLNFERLPYSATFTDPTEIEESIADEKITIICDENGKFCNILKIGGASCTQELLKICIQLARTRYSEIKSIIQIKN